MTACEQTDARVAPYVDGELDADEAEAFALHLASCAACRDALHEALQLVAVEARASAAVEARASAVVEAKASAPEAIAPVAQPQITALPSRAARARARRWGGRTTWIVGGAVLAAAAVAIALLAIPRGAALEPIALATSPVRSLEGRVSYAAADGHRDYAVVRAGGSSAPAEVVPLDALASLEQRGDRHGVAAGYLLLGDPTRASTYLEGDAPDVAADRALVLLTTGHPEDALIALDAVLAGTPHHPQAMWNRALALRDLGLTRMAGEAFTQVAALGELGWSAEARNRAQALRDEADQRTARFAQLTAAGPQLAAVPDGVSAELARQIPGSTRGFFDEAVRSAPTQEALRRLAPLATTLDQIAGDSAASDRLATAARADWATRGPLAVRYATVLGGGPRAAADVQALLAALRAAHQDDLVLGTLVRAYPAGLAPEQVAELQRLAGGSSDPWDRMTAIATAGRSMLAHDPASLNRLRPALGACTPRVEVWCARLELLLADSYLATNRPLDAQPMLASGLARTRRGGEEALETLFLARLAKLEASRPALARAYGGELATRSR